MITIDYSPNKTITQPGGNFTAAAAVVDTVLNPGSVSQSDTIRDAVITGSVGAEIRKDAQIEIGSVGQENGDISGVFPAYEMLTPAKGSNTQSPFVALATRA
jgi:hypothetical protein